MTLPAGFGELDLSDWIRGLLSAFISGGASAVTSGAVVSLTDPKDYAIGTKKFMLLIGSVFLISGTLNMLAFLRTKPIPDFKTVKTTVQTTELVKDPVAKVVTTVEEIHVEPKTPEKKEN